MDFKKYLKVKNILWAIFLLFAAAIAMTMMSGKQRNVDVQYGDSEALPSQSAMESVKQEQLAQVDQFSDLPQLEPSSNQPKPEVEIPKYNYLVELGRVIQNARDKPEALLEAQYSVAIERMEDRNRLASLVASELASKVDAEEQKRKLNELNGGVVAKNSDNPRKDVDPLLTSNELLSYNYVPADFELKNIGNTVHGRDAIIAYRGEHYGAVVGKELVAKVIIKDIQSDRVVLKTPNGEFTITLRL